MGIILINTSRKSLKSTSITDCLNQCREMKFRVSGYEFHTLTVMLLPVYRNLCKTKTTTLQNKYKIIHVLPPDDVVLAVDAVEPVFVSFHNILQLIIGFNTLIIKSANAPLIIIAATTIYFDRQQQA